MKEKEFKEWLCKKYVDKKKVISSRLSNICRINEIYDIDTYYAEDRELDLLDLFQYSKDDEKQGLEPKANIQINGSYYKGLSTLRQAINLYFDFLDDTKIITKNLNKTEGGYSPIFIGNKEDFISYVGPKCRNIVNAIAKSDRNKCNGICEYCGGKAELQSAHKQGEERPQIIEKILNMYYKDKNVDALYNVPLNDFIEKFKAAHMPIKKHIYFLCPRCHKAYDKQKTIKDEMIDEKRKKSSPKI